MPSELFANDYQTTLAGAITGTAITTCTVVDSPPAALAGGGQWRAIIEGEIVIVTAVSGTGNKTFTITRGTDATTASTHSVGAGVKHILTAASLTTLPIGASRYMLPSGADDTTSVQDALTNFAPYVSPHIVLGPGAFLWNSAIPTLARSQAAKITGSGKDKTKVTLSSGAPRFADFNRIADHDTFRDIEISDLTIDVNNITGKGHVLPGTYAGANVYLQRVNFHDITYKRVRVINCPSAPSTGDYAGATYARWHVTFNVFQPGSQEATQNTIRRVLVEDCDFYGGNVGVCISGTTNNATKTTINVWWDDITIRRCYHSCVKLGPDSDPVGMPTTTFGGINYQVGSYDWGGRLLIDDCYGEASFTGIGLSNGMKVTVRDSMIVDAQTGEFAFNNFSYVGWNLYPTATSVNTFTSATEQSDAQHVTFERCHVIRSDAEIATYAAPAFGCPNNTGASPVTGHIRIKDCTVSDFAGEWLGADALGWKCFGQLRSLTIDGLNIYKTNIGIPAATATTTTYLIAQEANVIGKMRLKRVSMTVSGTNGSGNTQNLRAILIGNGQSGGGAVNHDVELDDVRFDPTGLDSFATAGVLLGISGAVTNLQAKIARFTVVGNPSAGTCTAVWLPATTQTHLVGQGLRVEATCDLTAATLPTSIDATQNNLIMGAQVSNPSVPAASTALANSKGRAVQVFVTGGTGVIVSIDSKSTGLASGMFMLKPGQTISLGAYSVAPTWSWVGM